MPVSNDSACVIPLTDEERLTGNLTDLHMYDAIAALARDGLVIVENAVDTTIVDELNERMLRDIAKILGGDVKNVHWNQGADKGNISQVPPMEEKYLYPEIYANKPVGSILTNILGPYPELRYVRTNSLLPHISTRQKVHKDVRGYHLPHPCAIVLNVPLIDVTEKNGATEIWLGTHTEQSWNDYEDPDMKSSYVKQEILERRREKRGPVYPKMKKGSVVLRDLRLWHAGMPNHTSDTRIMLASVYFSSWYKNPLLPKYPKSLKGKIESLGQLNDTRLPAEYMDDEWDYLEDKFDGNFGSILDPKTLP